MFLGSDYLPSQMKIRDSADKSALRQIFYQHIPHKLTERPKIDFGMPVGDWLFGPLRHWAEDLLSAEALRRDRLIDHAPVRQAWAQHFSGQSNETDRLWIVLLVMAGKGRTSA